MRSCHVQDMQNITLLQLPFIPLAFEFQMLWLSPLRTQFTTTTLLPLRSFFHIYHHNCHSKLRALICSFEEPILSFRTVTFTLFQRTLSSFRFELNDSISNHRYQNLQLTPSKCKIY